MMIRVCPKRDAACPHGMDCPYSIDRYSCRDEPAHASLPTEAKVEAAIKAFHDNRSAHDQWACPQSIRAALTAAQQAPTPSLEEPDMIAEGHKYENERLADLMVRGEPFYSGAQLRAAFRHGYDFARALAGDKP